MNGILIAGYALVTLVVVFLLGTLLFASRFLYYWASWTIRWYNRRSTYVQITADVTRAGYDWWATLTHGGLAIIWVTYEHDGQQFQNRLTARPRRARQAGTSGIVQILIDPSNPHDAILQRY